MAHLTPAKVEFAVIDDEMIHACLEYEKKSELEENRKRHDECVVCVCDCGTGSRRSFQVPPDCVCHTTLLDATPRGR